jgi:predicted NAD-dependent protein-ADP-ribosyltransferase YbiA (DUF1768 family)
MIRARRGLVLAWSVILSVIGCAGRCPRTGEGALNTTRADYPAHWWEPVPENQAASWEILPQAAGPAEVILSKRNELGLLSNFAATPFVYRGARYASLEGFWQMMKYPENADDPRATFPGVSWPHTRDEVSQMVAFEAKAAGDLASANMKAMGIDWVTFEGEKVTYWSAEKGRHYALIVDAMREKFRQNPRVRDVLLSTGDLVLRPDHGQAPDSPPEWRYYEVWMEIRSEAR